jgi:hypothetical protein
MRYLIILCIAVGLMFADTETRQPDGDIDADGWTTAPLWSKIDEGSAIPGSDLIYCDEDNLYTDEVSIQDPTNAGTYTAIEVKIYAKKSAAGGDVRGVDIDLRIDGNLEGSVPLVENLTDAFAQYTNTWSGLSYDETEIATLQILFIATGDTGDPAGRDTHIDYIEVVLTYTPEGGEVLHHFFHEY